jgi:hypothetical protein
MSGSQDSPDPAGGQQFLSFNRQWERYGMLNFLTDQSSFVRRLKIVGDDGEGELAQPRHHVVRSHRAPDAGGLNPHDQVHIGRD